MNIGFSEWIFVSVNGDVGLFSQEAGLIDVITFGDVSIHYCFPYKYVSLRGNNNHLCAELV